MARCGGTGDVKEPDDSVREVVASVWDAANEKAGGKLCAVQAVQVLGYKTQVVAGTNYFVKAKCGDGESDHVHLRIFKGFDDKFQLHGIRLDHKLEDPLEYFEG
mmetsp:Transcript_45540/g.115706  ORF Transcript_45540/g.115706 Transcript_45540/m.115706 type:complete len:104 (-) Transcript_45540:73-384(-)